MKFGILVQGGQAKHSNLYIQLTKLKENCLFEFDFKEGGLNMFKDPFGNLVKAGNSKYGGNSQFVYLYQLCDLTNTITLCPPIVDGKTGEYIYDMETYEKAIRDDGYPVLVCDFENVFAFSGYNPNNIKKIALREVGRCPASEVGQKDGDISENENKPAD